MCHATLPSHLALMAELDHAVERWMRLCEAAAQMEGISSEEVQAEMAWQRARFEVVRKERSPAYMRMMIADIERAEAWVKDALVRERTVATLAQR